MKLHEAITQVLKEAGRPMTTNEIADALNRNGLYQKRDGSAISAFQIHGRTRNYSHLFDRNGSMVSLKGSGNTTTAKPAGTTGRSRKFKTVADPVQNETSPDAVETEMTLMDKGAFKEAGAIDEMVPAAPGLYCIRIKNPDALPEPFRTELKNRKHNIIYIGIASRSLNRRMLNQELRANGHGTFFRSIGAVLGYLPPFNSLKGKKNKRNYKFSPKDEQKIIRWINENLLVNWVVTKDFKALEEPLIRKYLPLLNLDHNPEKMQALTDLRKKCVEVANGIK